MTTRHHLIALLAGAGVLLAGCGGGSRTPAATTPATTSSTPASTPATTGTTQATPTTPTAPTTPGAPGAPAGGPVPAGFDPVAFTAISAREFWLLGTAPCPRPVCTSIVRTTDGGAHFVGIPAPVTPIQSPTILLFANTLDGFAGGSGYPEPRQLWETHDGGAHWTRGRADVIAFTVTAGHIYTLTGRCANGICSHLRLARSPAAADAWTSVALPVASAAGIPSLTASGTSAWISLTPAAGTPGHQVLLTSRDGGRTLTTGTSACYPGLGGRLEASSAAVVWAACPTGTQAGAWRTPDAGQRWVRIPGHPLPGLSGGLANSLQLAPASDSSVLLLPGGNEPGFLSTDRGATFARVDFPTANAGIDFVGFTDPSTGSALTFDTTGQPVGPDRLARETLWRSPDGGVHWRAIHIAATP